MNRQSLENWLHLYGQAWEKGDSEMAAALFTKDARYYETPFDDPLVGRAAIRRYWAEVPRNQTDIAFRCQVLSIQEPVGIVRWWAGFIRISSQKRVRLDGIFVITMNEAGFCRLFQEWWHRSETDVPVRERE